MIDRVYIGLFFGIIIGGCFTITIITFLYCLKPTLFKYLSLKYHTYWTNYHRRILYDLGEDGGTFDQYYTPEFKYHMAKYEYHSGKVGQGES